MQWIIDAYNNTLDKSKFFLTNGFTKHAGTPLLQQQIEDGMTNDEIKATWQDSLERFKKIRAKYLIYDWFISWHKLIGFLRSINMSFGAFILSGVKEKAKNLSRFVDSDFSRSFEMTT